MHIKTLLILIASFALFLVAPVKTHANDIDVVNTGENFRLSSRVTRTSNIRVTNINRAFVSQRVNAVANTGLNFASRNIGDVEIETGNARISTNLWFRGNENWTMIGRN